MNAFVRGCDGLRKAFPEATVLVVHHPGKDQSRGLRGSLALLGAADTVMILKRSKNQLQLVTQAQKDGEPAPPIWLRLRPVEVDDGLTSCVVELAGVQARHIDDDTIIAETPTLLKSDAGALSTLASFGARGARATEWQKATVEKAGICKTAFYAARSRLIDGGSVRQEGNRYHVAEPDQSACSETNQRAA